MIKFLLWLVSIPFIVLYKLLTGPIPGQKRHRRKRNKYGGWKY